MPVFIKYSYEDNWVIFTTELWDNFILSLQVAANAYLQERLFPRIAG